MFRTFILQYLNKLVKRKVRDFPSPQTFHASKVQRLRDDNIKPSTQIGREFPMPISALMAYPSIETGNLSDTPPPALRPFCFTAQHLVERPKFVQGAFQKLWRLELLACAQCQISLFQAKICPNAFTCCWQRFSLCVSCCDIKPVVTAIITLYRNLAKRSIPHTVFVKRIRDFLKRPFTCFCVPSSETQRKTIVFQIPASSTRIRKRLKLMLSFYFRSTAKFLEKSLMRCVNPLQLLLYRLARQRLPMRMCRSLEFCKMPRHSKVVRIRQSVFIPLLLPFMEVCMHLPHLIKQVANPNTIGLVTKLILIGFHGRSIKCQVFTRVKWVGRHPPCG